MNAKVFFVSFAVSAFWIIFTDYLVFSIFPLKYQIMMQNLKGIFFVLISNLILSWYVQRELRLYYYDVKNLLNKTVFVVSSIYSVLWILVSDFVVDHFYRDQSLTFQTGKGLFYVFTWSLLVAWFAQKEMNLSNKLLPLFKSSQIGLFTAMIIHEIRTPLTLIQHYSNQISSQNAKDVLLKERIQKNIQSLNTTVQFFQRLSRQEPIDSAELSEDVSLAALLNEVSQQILKEEFHINFINTVAPEVKVQGSYGLLSHLFMNLIKNAAEYLNQLGEDQLEILTTASTKGHLLCIRIENSGHKFKTEQLSQFFKPFSTKLKTGGTGFGLIVSQKIAEAHQGRLVVDEDASRPTFEVWLPMYRT